MSDSTNARSTSPDDVTANKAAKRLIHARLGDSWESVDTATTQVRAVCMEVEDLLGNVLKEPPPGMLFDRRAFTPVMSRLSKIRGLVLQLHFELDDDFDSLRTSLGIGDADHAEASTEASRSELPSEAPPDQDRTEVNSAPLFSAIASIANTMVDALGQDSSASPAGHAMERLAREVGYLADMGAKLNGQIQHRGDAAAWLAPDLEEEFAEEVSHG